MTKLRGSLIALVANSQAVVSGLEPETGSQKWPVSLRPHIHHPVPVIPPSP